MTVVDGRIIGAKHTVLDHPADCQPEPEPAMQSLDHDREMRATVRERDGGRPTTKRSNARARTTRPSASKRPSCRSLRRHRGRHRSRHRESRNIPVPDVLNIPALLRLTRRGRDVVEGDANYDERFLLYTGQDGKLLVFCADNELKVMRVASIQCSAVGYSS